MLTSAQVTDSCLASQYMLPWNTLVIIAQAYKYRQRHGQYWSHASMLARPPQKMQQAVVQIPPWPWSLMLTVAPVAPFWMGTSLGETASQRSLSRPLIYLWSLRASHSWTGSRSPSSSHGNKHHHHNKQPMGVDTKVSGVDGESPASHTSRCGFVFCCPPLETPNWLAFWLDNIVKASCRWWNSSSYLWTINGYLICLQQWVEFWG